MVDGCDLGYFVVSVVVIPGFMFRLYLIDAAVKFR